MTGIPQDVWGLFAAYTGREVSCNEAWKTIYLHALGEEEFLEVKFTPEARPLLDEIEALAAKHGLAIRILLPDEISTRDYRADRINFDVVKGEDGKWRLSAPGVG